MIRDFYLATRCLLLLLMLHAGGIAWADESHREEIELDHEQVFEAVQSGRIKPLSVVLAYVAETIREQVIGVEFEIEDDTWIYEIITLGPHGRVSEFYFDAATARLIKIKKEGKTEYGR